MKIPTLCLLLLATSGVIQARHDSALKIDRSDYRDRMEGFWLGQCIANWTGLKTEMDHTSQPFYTMDDWGGLDQVNKWDSWSDKTSPSYRSGKPFILDFVLVREGTPWGSDDDTDIEYIYQHLLSEHGVIYLSADQIREGWLRHIIPVGEEENYLWVANERALELMSEGVLPPETGDIKSNAFNNMIDAQLTTEVFGFFAPGSPEIALRMAELPIETTARNNAKWISEFYVVMYSLLPEVIYGEGYSNMDRAGAILRMTEIASSVLPEGSYARDMYEFVRDSFNKDPDKSTWEETRDAVNERYQINHAAGYDLNDAHGQLAGENGGFKAGINFAASLISLFYGGGDFETTVKIGTLCGWDSDNPTATWGGWIGFWDGGEALNQHFGGNLSQAYSIHRTRINFPDYTPDKAGEDSFALMAARALEIVDRVVEQALDGAVDRENDVWQIPLVEPFVK